MAEILIVDDHKLFACTLREYLSGYGHIVTCAANGKEALAFLAISQVSIILLDVQMPEMNGIDFLRELRTQGNHTKALILTQLDDESLIIHMLEYGANGFLMKNCELDDLQTAITRILTDGMYISDVVAKAMLRKQLMPDQIPPMTLSFREIQVLKELRTGASSKEIAKLFSLTTYTVESYRKTMMKKTRTKNVADLVNFAIRTGLIS